MLYFILGLYFVIKKNVNVVERLLKVGAQNSKLENRETSGPFSSGRRAPLNAPRTFWKKKGFLEGGQDVNYAAPREGKQAVLSNWEEPKRTNTHTHRHNMFRGGCC